jgi:non-specific serine/threonine protein kinase
MSLTRLIGRDRELGDLERLVAENRLVTLTGPGGTGKTRLASELALRTDWQREDSVAWIELAPCAEPTLIPQQVASALSLHEMADRGGAEGLAEALQDRELLLILDNCEHLIAACAELAGTLLARCRRLHIVATSREPLGIAGERIRPVLPLEIATEAVALFADRATAVEPSFAIDAESAPAVDEICRRLDGIPLAIELAAARVRMLTPQQIAARLAEDFSILSGGGRTTAPRHRTLRAAIDWSFQLLDDREQTLLARLSVFAGSFSLEAVEAVCGDDTTQAEEILDLLGGLIDKSLVVTTSGRAVTRYRLLETIRQYAVQRLSERQDAAVTYRRQAEAFLALGRESLPELRAGSVQRLDAVEADHDNIRAALSWSLEHAPDAIALPLAAAFRWYWYYRIRWSEGLRWLRRALEQTSGAASFDRAAVLTGAGTLATYLGDLDAGRRWLEAGEAMWRTVGDERQLALALSALAQLLGTTGEIDAATERAEESVALARRCGMPYEVAYCLTNATAFVAQLRGELEAADSALEEAQAIWSDLHHPLGMPFVLNARALLSLRRNDHAAAARYARAALAETRARRELWFASRSLRILAFTSARDPLRAAKLLGAANGMLRTITVGMLLHERSEPDRLMASLQEALPAEAIERAMEEGCAMPFEQACDFALAGDLEEKAAALPPQSKETLLHVADLGPLRITLGGQPLAAEGRAPARARELLLYLLAHPKGRTRGEVGLDFWPDATEGQVKNSFHVTMHRLRKILGHAEAVTSDGGRYRIGDMISHATDSQRFERELTAALRQPANGSGALEQALALYQGDYLEGEEAGEWCLPIRTRLRQLYLRGLFSLGQRLQESGRHADAAEQYARIIAAEPLHEAGWRQLMLCRARLGARAESLLLYRQLEERLRDELGTSPEAATRELYQRLLSEA